jgi:putative oxidoreductase
MNSPSLPSHSSHPALEKIACAGRSAVLLLIRLAWGLESFQSGWTHLHDVPTQLERFQNWHVPFPRANVYISGTTELVCGILLMAGLFSRIISIPLVFNFIVAIFAPHHYLKHLFAMPGSIDNWTNIIDDTAFPFLAASLVILAFGPGRISIDFLLQRTIFKNRRLGRHLVLKTKAPPMRAPNG